jgi:hypothetical protein
MYVARNINHWTSHNTVPYAVLILPSSWIESFFSAVSSWILSVKVLPSARWNKFKLLLKQEKP